MKRSIAGKRIIVTGASSGIGRALVLQLAALGCRLVINARRVEKLNELRDSLPGANNNGDRNGNSNIAIVPGDVSDPAVRQSLIETANQQFGGLDILINNAGIGALGRFSEATEERLRRVMEVNFFAPSELTRLAIPSLEKGDRPMIVNISSVLGHRGVPMKSEYCASKFAIHGWSDAIRAELVDKEIDVLLVSPSTTDSEFFDNVIDNSTNKNWKLSSAKSPAYVAGRTVKGIKKGNHEVILSWSGWSLVWLDKLMPTIANKLVSRFGK